MAERSLFNLGSARARARVPDDVDVRRITALNREARGESAYKRFLSRGGGGR